MCWNTCQLGRRRWTERGNRAAESGCMRLHEERTHWVCALIWAWIYPIQMYAAHQPYLLAGFRGQVQLCNFSSTFFLLVSLFISPISYFYDYSMICSVPLRPALSSLGSWRLGRGERNDERFVPDFLPRRSLQLKSILCILWHGLFLSPSLLFQSSSRGGQVNGLRGTLFLPRS